jgi:hypothetical protein
MQAPSLVTVAALAALAASARAQSVLFRFDEADVDPTPRSPALLGDVDGDGAGDFAFVLPSNTGPGELWVVSGDDGLPLYVEPGVLAAAAAGDVDADGRPDVVVVRVSGDIEVLAGASGTVVLAYPQPFAPGFGLPRGVGDLDLDGFDDLAVSDRGNLGRVLLISGQSGAQLFSVIGADPLARFGASLAPAGDVDGDGHPDVVVGAPNIRPDVQGHVFVLSGATGTSIRVYSGPLSGGSFGHDVAGIGDADGDGVPDLAAGAPAFDAGGTFSGMVRILSGVGSIPVHEILGQTPFGALGISVAPAGDLDLDGFADVVVGEKGASNGALLAAGSVHVYSGRTGAEVFAVSGGSENLRLGKEVDGGRDVNGDGIPDLIAVSGLRAEVHVLSGRPLPLAQVRHRISLAAGGTASFRLAVGPVFAGDAFLVLGTTAGTAPGLPLGPFLLPLNPQSPYFRFTSAHPNAGTLPDGLGLLDGAGAATARFVLPAGSDPALAGLRADHAFLAFDFAAHAVGAVSNAVPLTLVP